MGDGYSRSPLLLKGAIIQFTRMPIIPIPNIIVFQYNPESMSRSLVAYAPQQASSTDAAKGGETPLNAAAGPTSAPFDPQEAFSLSLFLDATDALEQPDKHPVAFVTGVADRLAALEMLLYPTNDSLLGRLVGSMSASVGGGGVSVSMAKFPPVVHPEVPVTLLVWGTGRIVPVRLTTMNVDELAWNELLYPTRAKVTVQMKVLTKDALAKDIEGSPGTGKDIALFCYDFTRAQKEALALLNVANTAESIGILPF